jgi:hypothetical protein
METIIKRIKKITKKKELLMNSPYVELSFLQADNKVKKELLEQLINSDDLKTKVAELYLEQVNLEMELNDINNDLRELNRS